MVSYVEAEHHIQDHPHIVPGAFRDPPWRRASIEMLHFPPVPWPALREQEA